MLEADLAIFRTRGKGSAAEQAGVEHLYRISQGWILEHYGDKFEKQFGVQVARLTEDLDLDMALNMTTDEYLASLPKIADQSFNQIAHDTGETRFRPLLVETRLPIEKLLEIGGFKFTKGLAERFKEHDAFFPVGEPYIVWPVIPNVQTAPQEMVIRKEGDKFQRERIGIYEAVNLVLQTPTSTEGVLVKIPYRRADILPTMAEEDFHYWDNITLGISNGTRFVECPDLATH